MTWWISESHKQEMQVEVWKRWKTGLVTDGVGHRNWRRYRASENQRQDLNTCTSDLKECMLSYKWELGEHCQTSNMEQVWLKHLWLIFFCISLHFILIFDLETQQISNQFKSGTYSNRWYVSSSCLLEHGSLLKVLLCCRGQKGSLRRKEQNRTVSYSFSNAYIIM